MANMAEELHRVERVAFLPGWVDSEADLREEAQGLEALRESEQSRKGVREQEQQ